MKRNDLWLNVKGNYVLFVGKILLNLYENNEALIWLKFKTMQFHRSLAVFDASKIMGYTRKNR